MPWYTYNRQYSKDDRYKQYLPKETTVEDDYEYDSSDEAREFEARIEREREEINKRQRSP